MTPSFEHLLKTLKQLPGLGHRSAERIALHLLVEKQERLPRLVSALNEAAQSVRRCTRCGNLAEAELCPVCADPARDHGLVCVVEQVPDLVAIERSGAYRGVYHVLHGKLSPIQGIGPEDLNLAPLLSRLAAGEIRELVLALSGDVEAEATCHYLTAQVAEVTRASTTSTAGSKADETGLVALESETETAAPDSETETAANASVLASLAPVTVTRIGFGLPSGGGVLYADSVTLKSALEARRDYS